MNTPGNTRQCVSVVFFVLLAACSAHQIEVMTPLDRSTANDTLMTLVDDVAVKAKNSKVSKLKAGTTWSLLGSIEQGDVFGSKDQIVIVNSFDVHEASIVVDDGLVVGYLLNVEETFVAAEPVKINMVRE